MTLSNDALDAVLIGYLWAMRENHEELACVDTWHEVGGYDLNLCGSDVSGATPEDGLIVYVYPKGWSNSPGEPIFHKVKTFSQAGLITANNS
jgi:hypothetical protein